MQDRLQELKSQKFITKTDIIIILAVLLLSIFVMLFFLSSDVENPQYNIYLENQLIKTGDLSVDGTFTVEASDGGYVVFVVENREIYAVEATCSDSLCILQGGASSSSDKIICLPNKISVEIVGGTSRIDAVT